MKMEIEDPEALFEEDPNGFTLCDKINEYLPETIRLLSIVRVSASFRARHNCCQRTYQYMLPYEIISESKYSLSDFRMLLQEFEGSHYFHNYTAKWSPKLRIIKKTSNQSPNEQQLQLQQPQQQLQQQHEFEEEFEEEEEEVVAEEEREVIEEFNKQPKKDEDEMEKDMEILREVNKGSVHKQVVLEQWGSAWARSETRKKQIENWRTPLALLRRISHFSCSPAPISFNQDILPNKQWVLLEVTSDGFLWHQIRLKMKLFLVFIYLFIYLFISLLEPQ